jgi:predicted TIM-barrel fold metal-dependent hydrolase
MRLIDTHQHLWDPARFSYSWCRGIPALDRAFTLDDYREAAVGTGIERTIFVECDVDAAHRMAEACFYHALAERFPLISGLVAACRPEDGGFAAELKMLSALPLIKGVRRVLHVVPDEVSRSPRFVDHVRRLAEYNFSFDLCVVERQLPLARALIEQCPEVSFVLDHCGVPEIQSGHLEFWQKEISELAACPNVVCKISGLVAYAGSKQRSAEGLQPWFQHAVEAFGWDRMLWGGDWPVCTLGVPLAEWVAISHSLVKHAMPEQKEKLFSRNASRIYRLD